MLLYNFENCSFPFKWFIFIPLLFKIVRLIRVNGLLTMLHIWYRSVVASFLVQISLTIKLKINEQKYDCFRIKFIKVWKKYRQ